MLSIIKEKVLNKKASKSATDNTADNNGPVFKDVRPVKLDFSATNFKAKVIGWHLAIEKKAGTLFPTVCDTARGIARITTAKEDLAQSEHQDPQIVARANIASEDDDSGAEHDNDKTQDHGEEFDKCCNNGGDNTDDDGIDDGNGNGLGDHNSGCDDSDHHNEGDNCDGTEEDNQEGSDLIEPEEDSDQEGSDLTEEDSHQEGSDLTEIGSDA